MFLTGLYTFLVSRSRAVITLFTVVTTPLKFSFVSDDVQITVPVFRSLFLENNIYLTWILCEPN